MYERYELYCKKELTTRSLEVARRCVGVRELSGRNDGEMVREFLFSVGIVHPSPYCVAGQFYTFTQACKELNLPTSEIPLERTGLAAKLWDCAKRNGINTEPIPQVGDIMVWRWSKVILGHVGRIINISGELIQTIEFNTNNGTHGNQRDGDGVWIRNRGFKPLATGNKVKGNFNLVGFIGFKNDN